MTLTKFKPVLASIAAIVGLLWILGWITKPTYIEPPVAPKIADALNKTEPSPQAPTIKPALPLESEFVEIKAKVTLSPFSGPTVDLLEVARGAKCSEGVPVLSGFKRIHTETYVSDAFERDMRVCLEVAKGAALVPSEVPGGWTAATGGYGLELESDYAYAVVPLKDGKNWAVRVAGLMYCANEENPCSGSAYLEYSVDDKIILAPLKGIAGGLVRLGL